MALELQLNTAKAAANLQKASVAIDKFAGSLRKLNTAAEGIGKVTKALSSIKGVNPQALAGIERLGKSLGKLKQVGQLDKVVGALNRLGKVDINRAVTAVKNLASALNRLKVPPGLNNAIKMLQRLGPAAQKASASVRQLTGALQRVRAPRNLQGITRQMQTLATQSRAAAGAMRGMGRVSGSLTGLLAGFGIALGGVGLAQFIVKSGEATRKLENFMATMKAFSKSGIGAEKILTRLKDIVKKLGLSLDPSLTSFKKLATAMINAGHSADEALDVFEGVSTAMASLKASGEDTNTVLNTVTQSFATGKISAEQFASTIGQQIPGAMQALADATGKSMTEVKTALEKGKIPAEAFIAVAKTMGSTFAEGAAEAAKSFDSAAKAMGNSVSELQTKFRAAFDGQAAQSVRELADAMMDPGFMQFVGMMGTIAGAAVSVAAQIAKLAAQFPKVAVAISLVVGLGLAKVIGGWIIALSGAGFVLGLIKTAFVAVAKSALLWAGITKTIAIVAGAVKALAIVMGFLAGGTLGAVIAIVAIGVAIGALIAIMTGDVTASEALERITTKLGKAWDWAKGVADKFLGPLGSIGTESGKTATGMGKTATASDETGSAFGRVSDEAGGVASGLGSIADEAGGAASGMGRAAGSAKDLATQTGPAASATGKAAANLGTAASNANRAATAYDRAAQAARRLAQAQAAISSAGGGGGGQGFAAGGIVSKGGTPMAVPAAAFIRAPRLATGVANTNTLNAPDVGGGGVAAVLHPNEAVIPLAGGNVPVSLSVSGGGAPAPSGTSGSIGSTVAPETLQTLELLSDINLEMGKNTTVAHVLATQFVEMTRITHSKLDTIINKIVLLGGVFTSVGDSIVDAIGSIQISGGGGGGTGGLGGGGGGFQGNLGDFQNAASIQAASDAARESLRGAQVLQIGTGNGVRIFTSAADRATDERAGLLAHQATGALHRAFQNTPGVKIKTQGGASTYSVPPEIFDQLPLSIRNMRNVRRIGGGFVKPSASAFLGSSIGVTSSFAKGTSNTSGEGMFNTGAKGALAVLHPNEAVIPLDGNRSVPVTLNSKKSDQAGGAATPAPSFLAQMGREEKRMAQQAFSILRSSFGQERSGEGGGGGKGVNVFMKIITPDADSFLENKDQIIQTLAGKLNRVKAQFGQKQISGDPTTFLRKKEREGV